MTFPTKLILAGDYHKENIFAVKKYNHVFLLILPVFSRNTSSHAVSNPPDPPAPDLCCMSGCANCVWIEYAKELKDYYKDDTPAVDEALKKIEDPSFRSFIKIEIDGILSKSKK